MFHEVQGLGVAENQRGLRRDCYRNMIGIANGFHRGYIDMI